MGNTLRSQPEPVACEVKDLTFISGFGRLGPRFLTPVLRASDHNNNNILAPSQHRREVLHPAATPGS